MAVEGAVATETPASPSPSQPSGGAASHPRPDTPAVGTQATSQPAPKWEDTPQYKGQIAELQRERKARQEYEKAVETAKSEAEDWRRKFQGISGLTPQDPKQLDAEAVRAKILELMPELADVGSIAEMRAELENQQVQGYANHSKGMIAKIHQAIASEYGDLTDGQKRRINAAYLYENQSNPEFHARHNAGDLALVAEFAKGWIDDLVEPIRKRTAASESSRFRPVPGGRDRSTPIKGEKLKEGKEMLANHFRNNSRQG